MKTTKNVFLARSYLQQYCSKPYVDLPLRKYIRFMNTLTVKENHMVLNNSQVKKLLKRVNK